MAKGDELSRCHGQGREMFCSSARGFLHPVHHAALAASSLEDMPAIVRIISITLCDAHPTTAPRDPNNQI